MKRIISRFFFSFRFAFKNLVRFRFRSILLIFSFIALFVTLLLGSSTQMFVNSYYYDRLENKYREIDFSMGITLNSNLRFFSIRPLIESTNLDSVIDDYAPFFEMDTLVEINGEKQYVKTMSSTLDNFVKVSNPIHYSQDTLGNNDVIITQSLADRYQLILDDSLTLYLGTLNKDYKIVDIVEDGGLFLDDTIYLNKDGNLSFFLSALSPALGSINPLLMANFYNQVYFNVNSSVSNEQAIEFVSSIPELSNLKYQPVIDYQAIDQMIRRITSFFNLIIIIVFFVILLVIQTTFMLYFQEKKKGFAIVNLLGGSNRFSYGVVLIEITIFFVISLALSVFITNGIIQNGLDYVGAEATYSLETQTILWCALFTFIIFLLTSLYYFISFNRESSIQQTMNQGVEKQSKLIPQLIIVVLSLTLYIVTEITIVENMIGKYGTIIQTILSVIILFSLSFLLVTMFSKLQQLRKKTLISTLQFKILLAKKSFYQYISVILVCFVSIFLLVLANDHMDKRMESYENEFRMDFVLTNFISRYDETFNQIVSLENVENAEKVGFIKDIDFVDFEQNLGSLVSMDAQSISNYFNFQISVESLENLSNNQKLVILLPERFHMLFDMQVGQLVNLNISPAHPNETFEIGGFFEKQIGDIAISNLHLFPNYNDINQNSIFVNAKNDRLLLKNELINTYSKNMVYVLDYDLIVDAKLSEMRTTTDYMTIILSTIIGCFILSIFNHSFLLLGQMKDTYARLYVLGFSKQKMKIMLINESLTMLLILLVSSITSFILLTDQLSALILISGEYENMRLSMKSLYLGTLIIFLIYALTKVIYIWGVMRIKPSEVVKTY
ncbi:MAG: hypothetical protein JXC31_06275 [Acholeplasmataceae bacterium]|nr:hypothetical protein [Acholeplasmataceae bacterium]